VLLDEIRLRQILINLVGNALKFTHEGEVKISLYVLHINVESNKVDLLIDIFDTGIGIPETQQKNIFSAFTQQENQGAEYGGTGLGLTISQRLLQLMNGSISVHSQEGEGSCFSITLKNVAVCNDEIENQIEIEESKNLIMALTKKKEQAQQNQVLILSTFLHAFNYAAFLTNIFWQFFLVTFG
jgi:two-component system sensor histidine kinase EvgS